MNDREYLTAERLSKDPRCPFNKGQIRHHLLHRDTNGLNKAARKVGKTLLIRMDLFLDWIESHAEADEKKP